MLLLKGRLLGRKVWYSRLLNCRRREDVLLTIDEMETVGGVEILLDGSPYLRPRNLRSLSVDHGLSEVFLSSVIRYPWKVRRARRLTERPCLGYVESLERLFLS